MVYARKRGAGFRDEEAGSIIVFSIFLLIILLFTIGFAVDTMRYETRRVAMQGTLDNAIVAASSLTQDIDAKAVVLDHVAKAGFNPDLVDVRNRDIHVAGPNGNLVSRSVSAESLVGIDTFFMNMLGFDHLEGWSNAAAHESVQDIEISLVLDISSSMNRNDRLKNLKVAAVEFVNTVLSRPMGSTGVTSISVIPYSHAVVATDAMLANMNADPNVMQVTGNQTIPGSLTAYYDMDSRSNCLRFDDTAFLNKAMAPTLRQERLSHVFNWEWNFSEPNDRYRWCPLGQAEVLPFSTSASDLTTLIQSLEAWGNTAIDDGVKWGVALLDPAFRPVLSNMIDGGIVGESVRERPGPYNTRYSKKYLIVMTDGANTTKHDLKDAFKNGPSRVWYSESKTTGSDGPGGRARTEFDGYYILMPSNSIDQRWYVPGDPNTSADDQYVALTDLPADALQLDYMAIYDRFAVPDAASFFFEYSDTAAYDAHLDALETFDSYAEADNRLSSICSAAKLNNGIEIFTIGFEAAEGGETAMRNCATGDGNYFDVSGTDISKAFASIAAQITSLRLTQ